MATLASHPPAMPRLRLRLNSESSLADAVEAWLTNLGASKPSPATLLAYRRDLSGITTRLAEQEDLG
ncbi:MAG: hypothetical protein M3R71_03550, partial [Actinomycetota bacterium]|nr:hypothetical protein [Actinomycetota bacterium]